MTRRHSTRLSQANGDEPEDDGQEHLASHSYPELGTILTDRPDPGRQITVIGMRRGATGYYGPGEASYGREPIYRGLNVQLPPDVHARVHDPSRPLHERALHLMQHLVRTPHPDPGSGAGVGRSWTLSGWAPHLIYAEEEGGRPATHTPVVLHGLEPDDAGDHAELHRIRGWNEEDYKFPHGHPVPLTGISWAHPEHDEEGYQGEPGYQHFSFPEPIHVRASLREAITEGIRVTAAAYDAEHDARNGDYNGGEQDTGMYWAEPAQQQWRDENLGPQEEAPPPAWDMMPPAMARLAELEEAQQFFGLRHHATTINGTQVDEAGDAPDHGTTPRAENPDSYDARSTEGQGDDRWNEAIPDGSKKDENAATVGMYPEGMSAGGGPGLEIGAFVAHADAGDYGWLVGHMRDDHAFPSPEWRSHPQLAELHEHDHRVNQHEFAVPHEHGEEFDDNPFWEEGDGAGGYAIASRRTARVPWTGKERGTLHRWQNAPTATWGDFVPSSQFPLLDPGEHVVHPEPDEEGLPPVEAAAEDPYWEAHLRDLHGLSDDQIRRAGAQGDPLEETHDVLHRSGTADHAHPGGPEDALAADPKEQSLAEAFGRDIGITPRMRAITRDRSGGSSRHAPSASWGMPAPFTSPDSYRQVDPARFKRMMSALNVHVRIDGKELHGHEHDDDDDDQPPPHEHDDPDNSLDNSPDNPPDNSPDKNAADIKSSQVKPGDLPDSPPGSLPVSRTDPDASGLDPDDPGHPDNWPQAGADVNETGRAYTQGSDDGKVKRGAPAPGPFSPSDADSGGGGDQDKGVDPNDSGGEEDTPFSTSAALAMFTAAAGSTAFRFEFTAAWHDVVAKAKRIRSEGHVRIVHASAGMVIGEVRGDHDTYESGIQRPVGRRTAIQHWACGCPWASFHQDKAAAARYAGRPCSHVMALQFEAQARGMFGRSFDSDAEVPSWSPQTVVVKSMPPYEGDPHAGQWREQWRAPLARRRATPDERRDWDWTPEARDAWEARHGAPADRATTALLRAGEDPGTVGALRMLAGMRATADQSNAPWGSQNVSQRPPQKPYGATSPPNVDQDPGSYGFLAAPDPDNWGSIQDNSAMQMPLTNTASRYTDQFPNVYCRCCGNMWIEPAPHGHNACCRPEHEEAAGNYAWEDEEGPDEFRHQRGDHDPIDPVFGSHQVLVPGAPRPQPGDLHWPSVDGWQQEDQGTFGYTDRANTAGPSTAMNARDPNGIRMEESRHFMRWYVPHYGEDSHSHAVGQATQGAAEQGRDHLLVPFAHQEGEFPKIAVTTDYSLGNHRGHFRVSPDGRWSRYNPDDGYSSWREPTHEDSFMQAHVNRIRDTEPQQSPPPDFDWTGQGHYTAHEGDIDPVFGKLAAGTPYPFRDAVPQLDGALAELKDHPEPALPETTGDDLEATAAADGTIGGGDAGTGMGQGAAEDTAALGEFGAARRMYLHHLAGTPMGDLARETWPQAQQPSPVGQEPGMGSQDEYLTPGDQSIQTIGNQQWSGGGADSDEVAVPAGDSQGDIGDIVAAFQRSAAAKGYAESRPGPADGDIATAARAYLSKTADALPQAEADALIREGRGQRARNLDLLRLEGTHYEDGDDEAAKRGVNLDDYDDDVMFE